ncbi:sulfatase-like hydrolase/transferase [Profundibacter sp.]
MFEGIVSRIFRVLLLTLFAYGVFHLAMIQLQWPEMLGNAQNFRFVLAMGVMIALFTLAPKRNWNDKTGNWQFWLWAILLILFAPFLLLKHLMGVNDIGTIIIFLNGTTVADATTIGVAEFTGEIAKELALYIAVLIAGFILFRSTMYFNAVLIITAMFLAVKHPVTQYVKNLVIPNPAHQLVSMERDFHPPQISLKAGKPKNLILVYLESMERTYIDVPKVQGAVQGMVKLAGQGVDATNVVQIYGSHNTVAGMVSTQCGAPLLPSSRGNTLNRLVPLQSGFMETVDCLGDVLSAQDYTLSYLGGADINSYSKRAFLQTHHYDRLFDVFSYTPKQLQGYMNVWGFDDEFLFDRAIEELEYLADKQAPFVLSLLTISTHGPDGFPDAKCEFETDLGFDLPKAMFCTLQHLDRLLKRVEELGLTDNTVVAVMSDHLAPPSSFDAELKSRTRRNYLVFPNADTTKIDKPATPLDVFPTILELLGFDLSQRRANFGVSILSPQPSLINLFGEELADQVFKGNSGISEQLWRMDGEVTP